MLLLLAALLYGSRAIACSSIPPIAIPWKNQQTQQEAISRGIPLTTDDNQELGLRISTLFSDTRVQSAIVCERAANATLERACESDAGSILDTTSTYFAINPSNTYNLTADPNDVFIANEYAKDGYYQTGHISVDLTIAVDNGFQTRSLPDYQLGVMSQVILNNDRKSGVGMGRWSMFLERLFDGGYIPSKVFGLYRGSYSDANPRDGELVIGGVNLNAMEGGFRNFTITDVEKNSDGRTGLRCPLQVPVSDLTVTVQGTAQSLFPGDGFLISACIDTFQQSITMPDYMMSRLLKITGAEIDHPNGTENSPKPWIPTDSEKKIDHLTLTILNENGSFEVTISGDEVMNPYETKDPEGRRVFPDDSTRQQLEFRNRSDNYPVDQLPIMILGGAFLSQQYLMVDYSRNTFGLAQAALSGGVSNGNNLVTICDLETGSSEASKNEDEPKVIALAVLAGVGWLLVILLSYLVLNILRNLKKKDAASHDRRNTSIFGTYRIAPRTASVVENSVAKGYTETEIKR
ncbi:hypothetical protein ABW20_dc0102794 [Dactylellina cionopaga]|nr:hypothetical protein ABW20_dc0102794 [Dactylellina cionopaga]